MSTIWIKNLLLSSFQSKADTLCCIFKFTRCFVCLMSVFGAILSTGMTQTGKSGAQWSGMVLLGHATVRAVEIA